MATYLKISQTQYQKSESGSIEISGYEWQKISKLLDVKVDDIFEEQSDQQKELSLKEELEFLKLKIKSIEKRLK